MDEKSRRYCRMIFAITLCTGCGPWTDWSEEQASRISILGEPVDEAAVRDAVATVLGGSDVRGFSIWFTLGYLPSDATHTVRGRVHLCTRNETIEIHMRGPGQCVANTSLVHELIHRWDLHVRGTPCGKLGHPVRLFGECGDGGLVGYVNDRLRRAHCPGEPKPKPRTCAR